jgi:ABC-2 type transport system ATP-binding protein
VAAALSVRGLRKVYANGFEALAGVDLEVEEGDFFALLGPNGAGKTTLIGILTGLVVKTAGTVSVFGHDLDRDTARARSCLGLVPQEFNFNIFERVRDILIHQAGYYGIDAATAAGRAETYLKALELWDQRNQQAMTLSGGMKRRLMIARALVHEPRLLLLDEPTAGVDIELRRGMWDFFRQLNARGTTIILTTHYLEEAELLCRNLALIDHGRILERCSVRELLRRLEKQTFLLDLPRPLDRELAIEGLKVLDPQHLEVELRGGQSLNRLFEELSRQGVEVSSLRNKANRLEELVLDLLGRSRR